MTEILRIGDRVIEAEEMQNMFARYQLLPQLIRGIVVDEAIEDYECGEAEKQEALKQFYEKSKLETPEARQAWQQSQGIEEPQLVEIVTRPLLVQKFKQDRWSNKVESYFMKRKGALDRVLYSLIRTKDLGLAQELYFRISEDEQSFSDLAREYSEGSEANTGGLVGPSPLNAPHPAIARVLAASQPGQLWPPTRLENWFVIIRLEKFYPAQLDDAIRKQLINELFENWVKQRMQELAKVTTFNVGANVSS